MKRRGGIRRRGKSSTSSLWGSVKDITGRWHNVNLHTFDRDDAKKVLLDLRLRAANGEWRPKAGVPKEKTISQFLPEALEIIRPHVKPKTASGYELIVEIFVKEMGDLPLKVISTREISQYLQKLRDNKRKNSTLRNHLFGLSAIFQVAKGPDFQYIERNPVRDLEKKPPMERPVPRPISEIEIVRILNAADEHWDLVTPLSIRLITNTGMRPIEVHSLKWEAVDLEAKVIRLEPSKNYRGRIVPLNRWALEVLEYLKTHLILTPDGGRHKIVKRRPHQQKYVICRKDGRPMSFKEGTDIEMEASSQYLNNFFRKSAKKAGVKARFYDCRHTFSSNLYRAGVDYLTVRTLDGHSLSGDITARYTAVPTELLHKAVVAIEGYSSSLQKSQRFRAA